MTDDFYKFVAYNIVIYISIFLYKINERRHPCDGFEAYIFICVVVTVFNLILYITGYIDYEALPKY
jgi:hypothetical protein